MSFIKNIAYWSAHFNGSVVQISKKDFEVLKGQETASSRESK